VRDPAVIRAYVKRKQILEEESTMADSLAPTGDIERDKRARKRYVLLNLVIPLTLVGYPLIRLYLIGLRKRSHA